MKVQKIFEGEFMSGFCFTFLPQLFSKKCFHSKIMSKFVRPFLASLSVNGLK